jgi:GNAT superfamily N-acetyltransferase
VDAPVELRLLERAELARVAEIDRTERIEVLVTQDGEHLAERHGDWSAPAWEPDGLGEHSVDAKVRELHRYADSGGVALGALIDETVVGIGVVVPHLRPGIAQLAFLHVSAPWRRAGIGSRLSERLEEIARAAGDVRVVVSATPSGNTVRFYLGRGFLPMAEPIEELFDLEPEDVHLHKAL